MTYDKNKQKRRITWDWEKNIWDHKQMWLAFCF